MKIAEREEKNRINYTNINNTLKCFHLNTMRQMTNTWIDMQPNMCACARVYVWNAGAMHVRDE